MPQYKIEREIPGAGKLTAEQLKGISQTPCGVLRQYGASDSMASELRDME